MSTYHQEHVGPADLPPPDNAAVLKLIARIEALLRRPADSSPNDKRPDGNQSQVR
jgi:hypothetical protein